MHHLLFIGSTTQFAKSYRSDHGRLRSRYRHTGSKFNISNYHDNHLSESIHTSTWTIGTLYCWLPFYDVVPEGPCGGGLEVKN